MNRESEARQRDRDMAYIAACREAGIEPELPEYEVRSNHGVNDAADLTAHADDCGRRNNSQRLAHLPLTEIEARELSEEEEGKLTEHDKATREAMGRILDILVDGAFCSTSLRKLGESARSSALRLIVLAWMIQRGPLAGVSLSTLATHLNCTRAALSWHARKLETATGFHSRGQKLSSTIPKYREARVRYLERCKAEGVTPATSARPRRKAKHPPAEASGCL